MIKKTTKTEAPATTADDNVTPAGTDAPAQPPVDLSTPAIQKAISSGKALIAEGKSKADAAREIFQAISGESKEVIVAAFVEGATLTPKGALTYWYNCKRRASKLK